METRDKIQDFVIGILITAGLTIATSLISSILFPLFWLVIWILPEFILSVIRPIVNIISLEILTLCIIGVIMVVFIIKMYKLLKGKYCVFVPTCYWICFTLFTVCQSNSLLDGEGIYEWSFGVMIGISFLLATILVSIKIDTNIWKQFSQNLYLKKFGYIIKMIIISSIFILMLYFMGILGLGLLPADLGSGKIAPNDIWVLLLGIIIIFIVAISFHMLTKGKYSIWMAGTYWVGLIYTFLRGLFWWKDFLESTQLNEVNYRRYMEDYVDLNIGFSLIIGCTLLVSGIIYKMAAADLKEKRAGKIIISISLLIAMLLVPIFLGFIVDDRENPKNFAIEDIKAMETIYPAFDREDPDKHGDAVIWEKQEDGLYHVTGVNLENMFLTGKMDLSELEYLTDINFGGTFIDEIILPESLEEISIMAFYKCDCLKEIVIPEHVKDIGDLAFAECKNLKRIIYYSQDSEIGMNSFYKSDGIIEIKCYQNSTESDYPYDCDPRFIYWPNLE